jgi:O-antigen biosynthesis protein
MPREEPKGSGYDHRDDASRLPQRPPGWRGRPLEGGIPLTPTTSSGSSGPIEGSPCDRENAVSALLARPDVPLVSVIVRSVDRPELDEALGSIARQTYPNIETVVVNAKGSGHRPLSDRCGRFPLRMVGTGGPLARSRAANAGLARASGELLIFLDDDDWLLPSHVAVLVAALELHREAEVAYAGVVSVSRSGEKGHMFNEAFSQGLLRCGNYIPLHSALFRRTVADRGTRFDETLERFEDWDFWLQLARHGAFVHVDQISACYRAGGASGVGLTPDDDQQRVGRIQVLRKWRSEWTAEQINEMAEACQAHERLLLEKFAEKDEQFVALTRQIDQLEATLMGAQRSWSFQLTRPLRWLGRRIRRSSTPSGLLSTDTWSSGTSSLAPRPALSQAAIDAGAPLISAIVPVYNACRTSPRFLRDALSSVCGQTYRNIELIVVDDGSTDATAEICEEFLRAQNTLPIRYLWKENGGQSSARNLGVARCHGEWVSFLDQDDIWFPDKLERVVALLRAGVDVVYSDADTIDEHNQTLLTGIHRNHRCGWPHPKTSLDDILLKDIFVMPGLMTVRRDLFLRVGGFDESLSGYEDDDLFLRLYLSGRIVYLPEATLKWRMHEENYSQSSRMVKSRLNYWKKLRDTYAEGGVNRYRAAEISRRFFHEILRRASELLRDGNPMYAENLASAKEIVPYLSLADRAIFGHAMKMWCRIGARAGTAHRLLQAWWPASESQQR